MYIIPCIEIHDEDEWFYKIKTYEEETIIEYYEMNNNNIPTLIHSYKITSYNNFDVKIAEAIIRNRKIKGEIDNEQ